MVPVKIVLPDGRMGEARIDIYHSVSGIKKEICEGLELGNPDSYVIAIYAKNEARKFSEIVELGCTLVIEKRIKMKEGEANAK